MSSTDNQYKTPESNLHVESEKKGSSVKAVVVAVCMDILGSVVIGIVVTLVFSMVWLSGGVTELELAEKISTAELLSPFGLTTILLGMLLSVFASFLCAKISRHNIVRDVSIACGISVLISVLTGMAAYGIMKNVILTLLNIASYFVGGLIGKRSVESRFKVE